MKRRNSTKGSKFSTNAIYALFLLLRSNTVSIATAWRNGDLSFQLNHNATKSLCLERSGETIGSAVYLAECVTTVWSSLPTDSNQTFLYEDGYLRLAPNSSSCVGPSQHPESNNNATNLLMVDNCTKGDYMRFLLTDFPEQRIQSIVNPDFCVVSLGSNESGFYTPLALSDCNNIQNPHSWISRTKDWPSFLITYSDKYLTSDPVYVSYILPYGRTVANLGPYNVTLFRIMDHWDENSTYLNAFTGKRVDSKSPCGSAPCSRTIQSGNVTFDIQQPGTYVIEVFINGSIAVASTTPFSISESSSNVTPTQAPSTSLALQCEDLTIRRSFTERAAPISALVIACLTIIPALFYIQAPITKVGYIYYVDVALELLEKFFTCTLIAATLAHCMTFHMDQTNVMVSGPPTDRIFWSGLVLAFMILVEVFVASFGYCCCVTENVFPTSYDSGKFETGASLFNGWILALVMFGGAGGATMFQLFSLYFYADPNSVSLVEQVIATVFLGIGLLPALIVMAAVLLTFLQGNKNPQVVGIMLYGCWRWYKLFAGEIPGVIFSFVHGEFLGYAWLIEVLADCIHLFLNWNEFSKTI